MEFFRNLFDTSGFPPRWTCGPAWTPAHGWTHIIADIVIFFAYAAIPISLAVIVIRRRGLPHAWLWLLFATFIFSCGFTHLVEASIFWYPWYRFSALMKVITASVSVVTAVALARALPGILAMPGIQRLNTRLRNALTAERKLSAELEAARTQLEDRTAHMTGRSRKIDAALSAAGVVACRWELETGAIDWEIGFAGVARNIKAVIGREFAKWDEVIGHDAAQRLREASLEAAQRRRTLDFQSLIQGSDFILRISGSPEPPVAGQPVFMVGMFRLIPTSQ